MLFSAGKIPPKIAMGSVVYPMRLRSPILPIELTNANGRIFQAPRGNVKHFK